MSKIYLLDTNVLMYDPKSIFSFADNEVIIPLVVLDELDRKKDGVNQAARHARMAIRTLDEMRALGNINEGVKTEWGGVIRVLPSYKSHIPTDLDPDRADNKIIGIAKNLAKKGKNVKIITKDINLRVKCDALKVYAEDYTSDAVVDNLSEIYKGFSDLTINSSSIDEIYSEGQCECEDIKAALYPNQYLNLISNTNPSHSSLVRFDGSHLVKINNRKNNWGIFPRNREQKYLLDALLNPDIKLVTISGRAGTGKTLMCLLAGVQQMMDDGIYKKIVITRPVQPVGRDMGFLPGGIEDKLLPWSKPILDNLSLIFSDQGNHFIDSLQDQGKIEIEALAYIRGRSINDSFIILDECQNLSRNEVKTMLTRVGSNAKICLAGDYEQIDCQYLTANDNGLSCAIECFKQDMISAHVSLMKGERSELATLAAKRL